MKKFISRLLTVLAILSIPALYIIVDHPDWVVDPNLVVSAESCADKCVTLPNPNRPSFDQWGNKFDYQGNLLSVGSCDPSTPSGANPYCHESAIQEQPINFKGK